MSPATLRMPFTVVLAATLLAVAPAVLAQVTVSLTAPPDGTRYIPPVNITLSATASASQGYTVSKVEFFSGTTLIGTDTTSPYSFTWNNAPSGQHVLTAKATAIKKNNPNQTATSAARNVTVNVNPVVTLTNPVPEATYPIPPPTITVSPIVSDSDGTIVRVEFWDCSNNTGLLATLTSPPYTYVWTLPPPYWYSDEFGTTFGRYGIRVDAYDNLGGIGNSSCTSVNVAPTVTLTAPANGTSFNAPANITLSATVSPSSGFPIGKIEFYQGTTLIGEDTTAPYSITWQNVAVGNYSLRAKVVGNGFEYSSTSVSVSVTPPSALHFVHVDHLNTPRLVANQSGQTVWRWDHFEPFGVAGPDENPSGLGAFEFPLRFPGQYFDKETNLHHNFFRDYDSAIGRYTRSDPIGLVGGLNTFAYVGSNPLSFVDPWGLAKICSGKAPAVFNPSDFPECEAMFVASGAEQDSDTPKVKELDSIFSHYTYRDPRMGAGPDLTGMSPRGRGRPPVKPEITVAWYAVYLKLLEETTTTTTRSWVKYHLSCQKPGECGEPPLQWDLDLTYCGPGVTTTTTSRAWKEQEKYLGRYAIDWYVP